MKKLLQSRLNPQVLKIIEEITLFQEKWQHSVDVKKDFYAELKTTTIITSAGSSTRIEGATLSDEEIKKKLVGLKIQKIRDRDEAEVAGYIDCKKYIFDFFSELTVSEHSIRSLHQMMMNYLAEDALPFSQRGAYKNVPNSVARIDVHQNTQEVIFETTPPGPQTETALRELLEDYQNYIVDQNYSPLEVIAAFVVKFLAIHPFRDGNGRLSRLLTDLCLLQQGYQFCMYASHEKIIEASKAQYYVALRQAQADLVGEPDINPWFFYFLKVLRSQTQVLQQYLTEPIKQAGSLTEKAAAVVELIKQHREVTISFLERETGFKRVTLKSILARLKNDGVLVMEGERKASRYRLR